MPTDYTLVLTAALGRLDHNAAHAASKAIGHGLHWLEPGTAAEAPVGQDGLAARDAVREALKDLAVDVNVLPGTGRRKQLLVADMDSTIIGCECIDEIADVAGLKPQVAAITERAMRGELPFEEALKARVALLKGLPEATLETVFRERVRLNPGARTLVQTMAANGAYTALVSGGFTYFTSRVAEAAGFATHRANELGIAAGLLTGAVAEPILGRDAKRETLEGLAQFRGLSLSETIAVGDGANDLAMIERAGLSAAYRAKPVLKAAAQIHLDHSDLTALLYVQGYRSGELVN